MPLTRQQLARVAYEMIGQVTESNPDFVNLDYQFMWVQGPLDTPASSLRRLFTAYREALYKLLPQIYDDSTCFETTIEQSSAILETIKAANPNGMDRASEDDFWTVSTNLFYLLACDQRQDLSEYPIRIQSAIFDIGIAHGVFETLVNQEAEGRIIFHDEETEFDALSGLLEHIKFKASEAEDGSEYLLTFYRQMLSADAIHPTACALALLFQTGGKEIIQQVHADTREENVPEAVMAVLNKIS